MAMDDQLMSASELSMELGGMEDSMRSIDLGSAEAQAAAELVVSGEAVSPNRMKELERMFPESGGDMTAAIGSSSSPPPATVAVVHSTEPEPSSLLAPGARLSDDCLLQIFRWLRPWPDLAVVRCQFPTNPLAESLANHHSTSVYRQAQSAEDSVEFSRAVGLCGPTWSSLPMTISVANLTQSWMVFLSHSHVVRDELSAS